MNKIVCRTCGREVALRKDGKLPRHAVPGQTPDITIDRPLRMCEAGESLP